MFGKKTTPTGGISEGGVQSVLHAMELGAWAKYIKAFLFALLLFALLLIYLINQFRGLELPEAMDQAQIARNLMRGEGFTTKFIRPLSAWTVKQVSNDVKLKDAHPDLFNAPLFPRTLAAIFKLFPPSFDIKPLSSQPYTKFPPDTYIVVTCAFFFLVSGVLVYVLARQLFDKRIAFISLLLFVFSDLLWRFSISGLPTTMLLFLFLGVQVCLVNAHRLAAEDQKKLFVWGLSAAAGLLCGLCLLTKYSAGWLIIPVACYAAFGFGKQRWVCLALVLALFVIVSTPWLARNDRISGKWFGLAGLSTIEQTERYPNDTLVRTFKGIADPGTKNAPKKLLIQARGYAENMMARSGAGLVMAFFVVGLLYRFKKPEVLGFRRFVLWSAILAVIVSSLGSVMSLSKDSVTSPSNLLVILCPGLIILGTRFFFLLFDQLDIKIALLKHGAVTLFVILCAGPLVFSLLPPRKPMIRYPNPPYYEPILAQVAKWVQPQEMLMTDQPWAMAWYGDRKALWLPTTLEEFYQINDYNYRVSLLYLSPVSLDRRFLSEGARRSAELRPWVPLLMGRPPQGFPLVAAIPLPGFEPEPLFPDHLVYADRARWSEEKK